MLKVPWTSSQHVLRGPLPRGGQKVQCRGCQTHLHFPVLRALDPHHNLRFKGPALTSSWFFLRSIISALSDSNCISRSDLLRVRLSSKGRRLLMSASTFCRRPLSVSYLPGQRGKVSPGLGFSVLLLLTLFMEKFMYFSTSVSAFISVLRSAEHRSTSRL